MPPRPDDICPRPDSLPSQPTRPVAPPIYLTSVWSCESTEQAGQLLSGELPGYVYQRDGHPNADMLAAKFRHLHGTQRAAVTSSGMSALALVLLSQLQAGDHIVASNQLYGRSLQLLQAEARRIGIACTTVAVTDLTAVESAVKPNTRLIVVETIANPLLRVADLTALADVAHASGARLLVDNSFATPILCQPRSYGADWIMESVTKMANGHSDVVLGVVCGEHALWERVPLVLSSWGFAGSPFDCWLASRGLATLHLRMARACDTALATAQFLSSQRAVDRVDYPGLPDHPDHAIASRQLTGGFGSVVTFHLRGGRAAADAFIRASSEIWFCPSLGEISTTISHPESTSHRGMSAGERAALGISGGTIRLSLGMESRPFVLESLGEAFRRLDRA